MYIPAIIAGLISFIMTPFVIKMAHKLGAVDVPKDDRRMHKKPMPLWGGVAIFTGFFCEHVFIFEYCHDEAYRFVYCIVCCFGDGYD